jgi:orotate phosphoribosyltransferase
MLNRPQQEKRKSPDMNKQDIARIASRILIETKSVLINAEKPFTFTSGWASPTYTDCRRLISFPRARNQLLAMGLDLLALDAGVEIFDAIAGGETAGIPYAAWFADRMGLPMLYVRKKPKGFGRNALIEGNVQPGQRVLLVEDLATDGKSKMHFVNGLREAGAEVKHCFVVFHYGIFPESTKTLADNGVKLHALCTWWDVLAAAEAGGAFKASDLVEVRKFLESPATWSVAHGGAGGDKAATG